jgi:pimeloyl-ACP methyl ester carboxylesterase
MSLETHGCGRLELAFESWGRGEHLLICLHGYGKERSDFRFLAESLTESHTCLLIDLPFHGDSKMEGFEAKEPLSVEEWNTWFRSLIRSAGKPYHTVLGFSLGGRLSLNYAQFPAEGFKGLILLASDGILMNPWNRLFTHTSLGRRVFGYYMRASSRPESLALFFEKWKLITSKRRKLIADNVSGPEAKQKLLATWLILRRLWPDLARIDRILKDGAYVNIFLGRYDQIIRPRAIKQKLKKKGLSWPVTDLNCGHDMMNKAVFTIIKEELIRKTGIE